MENLLIRVYRYEVIIFINLIMIQWQVGYK